MNNRCSTETGRVLRSRNQKIQRGGAVRTTEKNISREIACERKERDEEQPGEEVAMLVVLRETGRKM